MSRHPIPQQGIWIARPLRIKLWYNRRMRWRIPLLPLIPLVVLMALSCQKPAESPSPSSTPSAVVPSPASTPRTEVSAAEEVTAEYVGTDACAACHADIARDHANSRHMATLWRMGEKELGKLAPPPGRVSGTPFTLISREGRFRVQTAPGETIPLHLAFGSGKSGMTYVTAFANGTIQEFHKSYFVPNREWYTTPGQEQLPANSPGQRFEGSIARKCILCHAVYMPEDRLALEKRFLGVGCESCHGPGSQHIAAAQAGRASKAFITGLKGASGATMIEACGKCHRTADSIPPDDPVSSKQTQRFQPYGLSLSRCYKESQDRLTCTTCHDPHRNADTDPKHYEKVCLTCHSGSSGGASGKGKICPVNAKEKCVSCHMPRRQVFTWTNLPTSMADHYIRIFKQSARK